MNKEKFDYNILQYRADGRLEWVCDHGIGHTIDVPEEYAHINTWWIHGCDGCCKGVREKYLRWKNAKRK
jgi:hypothetical protein